MDILRIVAVLGRTCNSRTLFIWGSNMYLVCLLKTNMQNYRVAVPSLCLESVNTYCAFVNVIKSENKTVRKPDIDKNGTGPCVIKPYSECTGAQNVQLNFQFCIWMLFHSTETTSFMTSYPTDNHHPPYKAKYEKQRLYQRINILIEYLTRILKWNWIPVVQHMIWWKKSTWSYPICLEDNTRGSDRYTNTKNVRHG